MLETFGCRLRKLREGKNMTMSELAQAAGIRKQTVSLLEAEKRDPSWATVCKLADALDVDPATFRPRKD